MAEMEQQQAPEPAAPPPPRSRSEIAADLFGKEFHGEVGKAEPEETAPPPDDTEEGAAPKVEEPAEGEPEETGEPEEETAPEDTGETPIASVSELVEHLEADPEWFNTLKVPVHVDGTPTEATIGDLIKSYQTQEAAEHRLDDAKKYAQVNTEAWAAKQNELEGQFQVLAEMIKEEEAILEGEIAANDTLRTNDPAEWAARQTEFNQRKARIAEKKQDTVNKYVANAQARATEFENRKAQFRMEQRNLLMERAPDLQDQKRAETENARVAEYLYHSGFTPQEYDNLLDHRYWLLARKAMQYDQSRGQVDAAKKRVAKVPKVMKPGAPKPFEQRANEKLQALKSKLEKSGTVEDAVAYRLAKRGAQRR